MRDFWIVLGASLVFGVLMAWRLGPFSGALRETQMVEKWDWNCGTCGSRTTAWIIDGELSIMNNCGHLYVPTGSEPWSGRGLRITQTTTLEEIRRQAAKIREPRRASES